MNNKFKKNIKILLLSCAAIVKSSESMDSSSNGINSQAIQAITRIGYDAAELLLPNIKYINKINNMQNHSDRLNENRKLNMGNAYELLNEIHGPLEAFIQSSIDHADSYAKIADELHYYRTSSAQSVQNILKVIDSDKISDWIDVKVVYKKEDHKAIRTLIKYYNPLMYVLYSAITDFLSGDLSDITSDLESMSSDDIFHALIDRYTKEACQNNVLTKEKLDEYQEMLDQYEPKKEQKDILDIMMRMRILYHSMDSLTGDSVDSVNALSHVVTFENDKAFPANVLDKLNTSKLIQLNKYMQEIDSIKADEMQGLPLSECVGFKLAAQGVLDVFIAHHKTAVVSTSSVQLPSSQKTAVVSTSSVQLPSSTGDDKFLQAVDLLAKSMQDTRQKIKKPGSHSYILDSMKLVANDLAGLCKLFSEEFALKDSEFKTVYKFLVNDRESGLEGAVRLLDSSSAGLIALAVQAPTIKMQIDSLNEIKRFCNDDLEALVSELIADLTDMDKVFKADKAKTIEDLEAIQDLNKKAQADLANKDTEINGLSTRISTLQAQVSAATAGADEALRRENAKLQAQIKLLEMISGVLMSYSSVKQYYEYRITNSDEFDEARMKSDIINALLVKANVSEDIKKALKDGSDIDANDLNFISKDLWVDFLLFVKYLQQNDVLSSIHDWIQPVYEAADETAISNFTLKTDGKIRIDGPLLDNIFGKVSTVKSVQDGMSGITGHDDKAKLLSMINGQLTNSFVQSVLKIVHQSKINLGILQIQSQMCNFLKVNFMSSENEQGGFNVEIYSDKSADDLYKKYLHIIKGNNQYQDIVTFLLLKENLTDKNDITVDVVKKYFNEGLVNNVFELCKSHYISKTKLSTMQTIKDIYEFSVKEMLDTKCFIEDMYNFNPDGTVGDFNIDAFKKVFKSSLDALNQSGLTNTLYTKIAGSDLSSGITDDKLNTFFVPALTDMLRSFADKLKAFKVLSYKEIDSDMMNTLERVVFSKPLTDLQDSSDGTKASFDGFINLFLTHVNSNFNDNKRIIGAMNTSDLNDNTKISLTSLQKYIDRASGQDFNKNFKERLQELYTARLEGKSVHDLTLLGLVDEVIDDVESGHQLNDDKFYDDSGLSNLFFSTVSSSFITKINASEKSKKAFNLLRGANVSDTINAKDLKDFLDANSKSAENLRNAIKDAALKKVASYVFNRLSSDLFGKLSDGTSANIEKEYIPNISELVNHLSLSKHALHKLVLIIKGFDDNSTTQVGSNDMFNYLKSLADVDDIMSFFAAILNKGGYDKNVDLSANQAVLCAKLGAASGSSQAEIDAQKEKSAAQALVKQRQKDIQDKINSLMDNKKLLLTSANATSQEFEEIKKMIDKAKNLRGSDLSSYSNAVTQFLSEYTSVTQMTCDAVIKCEHKVGNDDKFQTRTVQNFTFVTNSTLNVQYEIDVTIGKKSSKVMSDAYIMAIISMSITINNNTESTDKMLDRLEKAKIEAEKQIIDNQKKIDFYRFMSIALEKTDSKNKIEAIKNIDYDDRGAMAKINAILRTDNSEQGFLNSISNIDLRAAPVGYEYEKVIAITSHPNFASEAVVIIPKIVGLDLSALPNCDYINEKIDAILNISDTHPNKNNLIKKVIEADLKASTDVKSDLDALLV